MKTSIFLAAITAFGIAAPSVSAQPRARDHRAPSATYAPAHRNERVPSRPDRPRRRDRVVPQVVVSSYAPQSGKAGTKVVVRGQGFVPGTVVLFGNQRITPRRITPTKISFRIPRDATGAAGLRLQVPNSRRLFVLGGFQVSERDAAAERARREAERQRRAQKRWEERQAQLARSAQERRERLARREAELRESRQQRRRQRRAEIRARFRAAFLADAQTQAELSLHAQRVARLRRMLRLAEANTSGKLVVRIEVALDKENQRHERRMGALESSFVAN